MTHLDSLRRVPPPTAGRTRLALFDFDGTLADSFPVFAAIYGDVADRHGFRRFGPEEMDGLRTLGAREILAKAGVPMWKLPAIATDMRRRMAARVDEIGLFPGTAEMMEALVDAGVRIAVATSNGEETVRRVLGPSLAARVDQFGCGVALFGKGRTLRRILAAAKVAPGEAVLIGDELRDLEAAREAGVRFVGVAWGYTRPTALRAAGAAAVVERMDDLAAAVLA